MESKNVVLIAVLVVIVAATAAGAVLLKNNGGSATEHTLTYDVNGGDPIDSVKFTEKDQVTLSTAVRDGYEFAGWYDSSVFAGTARTAVEAGTAADVTVYAKWRLVLADNTVPTAEQVAACAEVKVTYTSATADRTVPASVVDALTSGKTLVIDDTVNKVTWTFDGASAQEGYGDQALVTSLEVKPDNAARNLVLDFDYDGTLPYASTVKAYFGDDYAGGKVTVQNGTDSGVLGPYEVDDGGYVAFPVTHCSAWTVTAAYDVTFDANGGTIDGEKTYVRTVPYGTAVGAAPEAVCEGYSLYSWSPSFSEDLTADSDMEYKAVWGPSGNGEWGTVTIEVLPNFDITIPKDWTRDVSIFEMGGDLPYFWQFSENWSRDGYTAVSLNSRADGTGDSYDFGEWVDRDILFSSNPFKVYIMWQADDDVTVDLSMDANFEGAVPPSVSTKMSVDAGSTVILPDAGQLSACWTYAGHLPAGFNTKADGTGDSYDLGQEVPGQTIIDMGGLALFVQWADGDSLGEAVVYVNGDCGDPARNCMVQIGEDEALYLPSEEKAKELWTKEGYVPAGFLLTAGGYEGYLGFETEVPGEWLFRHDGATVDVLWQPADEETVEVDIYANYDGASIPASRAQYGTSATAIILPENDGLSFLWPRTNYVATGYNSAADGSGTAYSLGQTVSMSEMKKMGTLTVYVMWEKVETPSGCAAAVIDPVLEDEESRVIYADVLDGGYRLLDVSDVLMAWDRDGYRPVCFNTRADCSGTSYAPGSFVDFSAFPGGIPVLYVIWQAADSTMVPMTLHANFTGASPESMDDTVPVDKGDTIYLADREDILSLWDTGGLIPTGYNTAADGSGTSYALGQIIYGYELIKMGSLDIYVMWGASESALVHLSISANFDGAVPPSEAMQMPVDPDDTIYLPTDKQIMTVWTYDGHEPAGLNTAADGSGTPYSFGQAIPGSTLIEMGALDLYVMWAVSDSTMVELTMTANFDGAEPPSASMNMPVDPEDTIYLADKEQIESVWNYVGHEATGFNTAADGSGTAYAFGQEISGQTLIEMGSLSLYVMWAASDSTWVPMTLYANFEGASPDSMSDSVPVDAGDTFYLDDRSELLQLWQRSGHAPTGYNTAADGSGTSYALGHGFAAQTLIDMGSLDLYIMWDDSLSYELFSLSLGDDGADLVRAVYECDSGAVILPDLEALMLIDGVDGYRVAGYNTAEDGSGKSYALGERLEEAVIYSMGGLTLYPVWIVA